jgi:hypothetical protein
MPKTAVVGACRVCGRGPTIDAHLFPRALAHDLRGEEKHLFVGAAAAPGRRIVQAGLFDPRILCATHEGALGAYDDYGIEFCRSFQSKCQHPARNIWRVHDVDGDLLTKFWLAILWRFGVSQLREASLVRLGPFEDRLRDILFSNAPCSAEPAILMVRYRSHVLRPENICLPPYATDFPILSSGRRRAYSMSVAGFQVLVKVDSQPLPGLVHNITINGKSEITGGYVEFEQTKQFDGFVRIAKNIGQRPARTKTIQRHSR